MHSPEAAHRHDKHILLRCKFWALWRWINQGTTYMWRLRDHPQKGRPLRKEAAGESKNLDNIIKGSSEVQSWSCDKTNINFYVYRELYAKNIWEVVYNPLLKVNVCIFSGETHVFSCMYLFSLSSQFSK